MNKSTLARTAALGIAGSGSVAAPSVIAAQRGQELSQVTEELEKTRESHGPLLEQRGNEIVELRGEKIQALNRVDELTEQLNQQFQLASRNGLQRLRDRLASAEAESLRLMGENNSLKDQLQREKNGHNLAKAENEGLRTQLGQLKDKADQHSEQLRSQKQIYEEQLKKLTEENQRLKAPKER